MALWPDEGRGKYWLVSITFGRTADWGLRSFNKGSYIDVQSRTYLNTIRTNNQICVNELPILERNRRLPNIHIHDLQTQPHLDTSILSGLHQLLM